MKHALRLLLFAAVVAATGITFAASPEPKPAPAKPETTKPAPALTHWITTKSGIRHNSKCRYYHNSKGRPCTRDEGRACKKCGG